MSRLTINLTLIVFFLSILSSNGQSKKLIKETFYEAEAFLLYEEYNEAKPFYDSLLSWFPDNNNYKYRLGMCYLNMPGEKDKSIAFLQEAVQNINPGYKDGRVKETGAAYDALYYLAKAYQVTNQLDKAIETFSRFLDGMNHKLYDSTLVKMEIEACYNAKRLMELPLYLKSVNPGDIINERFSEVNPVVSADESTMVFTREAQLQDMIVYTRKVNNEWTPGIVIMDQLLVDEGYSTSISADGRELFVYRNDGYDGNIYSSTFVDGRWQPAVKLNENINTKYWESHASISADGKTLFFTSNKPGGFGGLDIYMSTRTDGGDWGPAVNLGPTINTPFNEETPFLDKTDKVLFFSSRGHFSMGGHDVFYTTRTEDGSWAVPANMGYPVNGTDDDTFFHPVGQGYTAYVSKFDPDGYGLRDIHRVEIFSDDNPRKFFVRGMVKIKDLMARFADSVKISTLDRKANDTLLIVYSDPETGEYEFEVPQGEYSVVYESEGSKTTVADLNLALTHPEDYVSLPTRELPKTDMTAEINLVPTDSVSMYEVGDTASMLIMLEPSSILVVEHWRGDSLMNREEYIINDTKFNYNFIPYTGDNNIRFSVTDRFNNTTIKEFNLTTEVPEPVIPVIVEDPVVLVAELTDSAEVKERLAQREQVEQLGQIISEVPGVSENENIKDAIEKTQEKNIQNAGEFLESLYTIAIDNGADPETLARLTAALSAHLGEDAAQYLERLAAYTDGMLRRAIESLPMLDIGKTPEAVILFLLEHCEQYGYTQFEVFEAFARMINDNKKSAEDILEYIESSEGSKWWLLWILLCTGTIVFFIIWVRRRKDKKD